MSDAIAVDALWETYARRSRGQTLKSVVGSLGRVIPPRTWALQDVSFSVPRRQMLGVIGPNGSGKSTLLRCLAGIFRPTRGQVTIEGRAASLIDLTAGFHVDLSTHDNVLQAGSIYGLPRRDLIEMMDDILGFAGLESYRDESFRSYSMGMAMRLGFSLAVSLKPDVLLVDEVLAVGDEGFKVRCLEKVRAMVAEGTTVVFASHELALVRSICDRVIVLDGGRIILDEDPDTAVRSYCEQMDVDVDDALERTTVDPLAMKNIERAWSRSRR